jgi:hypothetical protein
VADRKHAADNQHTLRVRMRGDHETALGALEPANNNREHRVNRQQYESYMDHVQDTIDRCGWMCQAVGADGDGPSWVYTIGLEDIQQAEMVVVNLSMDVSAAVMNRIGLEAQAGTRPWPVEGDTITGILANDYALRVLNVDPDIALGGEWFNMALNRRRSRTDFGAIQLVWQERDGSWPTTSTLRQPLLGTPWR